MKGQTIQWQNKTKQVNKDLQNIAQKTKLKIEQDESHKKPLRD